MQEVIERALPYCIAVISIGTFLIALHKGWLQGLFNFFIGLFFKGQTSQIDLNWEVRRIRRLLEFFYFLTWLGIILGLLYFAESRSY